MGDSAEAAAIKSVFRKLDETGEGKIPRECLLGALEALAFSTAELSQISAWFGTSSDGNVDYNVFVDQLCPGDDDELEGEEVACRDRLKRPVYRRSPDHPPPELTDNAEIAAWYRQRLVSEPMKAPDPSLSERDRELLRMGMAAYIAERRAGRVTCEEYTRLLVKRARYYRYLNQWTYRTYRLLDQAVEKAIELDAKAAADGVEAIAPLYGLPVPVKGTSAVIDYPSGAGCGLLSAYTPVKNSAMAEKILSANGIIFGTTNVPPFAFNVTTTNAHSGVTRNPYGHHLTVGGSSGGSASCVASYMCPLAVSEDTGGSTRIPSWHCQLFGFDPARNHFPNEGNTALSYTKDQIGVVARRLEDIILYDQLVMGARHGAGALHTAAAEAAGQRSAGSVRIGVPKVPFLEAPALPVDWPGGDEPGRRWALEPSCAERLEKVRQALSSAGLCLVEEEWPDAPGDSEVNVMVKALYAPRTVNGKPFYPGAVALSSAGGQVAQWVREYLDADASLKEIAADCEGGGLGGPPVDETQFRYYMGPFVAELVAAYNAYFDLHEVDLLLVPAGAIPTPDFADVKGRTCEVHCADGSTKQQGSELYFPHFIAPLKELHIPKLLVPTGLSHDGRPMAVQLWGRAVAYDAMFDDVESSKSSIGFLHLVRHAVSAIHADDELQRKDAPLVEDLLAK